MMVGASTGLEGALAPGAPAAGNLWSAQTMTASNATTPAAMKIPFFMSSSSFSRALIPDSGEASSARTCYNENLFRNPSLPDSQVSRFKKIRPPTNSSSTPLKTSTVCRCRRNF